MFKADIHNSQNLETMKMFLGMQMDKLWYIQTKEYYLALKRNEPPSQEKTLSNINT